ncbi:IclR family transcriptional regulator [Streptomyces sp. NPDC005438]|uniref:IclR family transcriptional regulator n=1 Tax=Streptomyces sp. NPDC005438 TaxID=3156880 RepID=UPI00339EB05D
MDTASDPSVDGPPSEAGAAPASILSKAFELLTAFGPERRVLTLSQLSRHSGLPKSTVHRLIGRLVPLGFLEPHGSGFRLGIRIRTLAAAMPVESLRESALPHLAHLHKWSTAHVHLAALRDDQVAFVERFVPSGSTLRTGQPGDVLPAHATAVGKALLAFVTPNEVHRALERPLRASTPRTLTDPADLDRELRVVRETRVAYARDEWRLGVSCIAAPVVMRGRAVGAVSVSVPTGEEFGRQHADAVRVVADRIARDNQAVLAQGHDDWFPVVG